MDAALGKRERNNLERRASLLGEARRLFGIHGVEATTVGQIAAAADVALRTVYNFFPTKVDLLAAVLHSEIRSALVSPQRTRRAVPADARAGVLALIKSQFDALDNASKSEQQLVAARAILAGATSQAGRYSADIDALIRTAIGDRLAHYVASGALRRDLDAQRAADAIFAMMYGLYFEWLQSHTTLRSSLPRVVDYLDLMLRR